MVPRRCGVAAVRCCVEPAAFSGRQWLWACLGGLLRCGQGVFTERKRAVFRERAALFVYYCSHGDEAGT